MGPLRQYMHFTRPEKCPLLSCELAWFGIDALEIPHLKVFADITHRPNPSAGVQFAKLSSAHLQDREAQ